MRSVNKVILIGNLTRDPQLRETTNGQKICTFGLATNRDWVTTQGERQNSTEFHELVAWSKLADLCQQHLKKGKLIYIEGYLKTRSWDSDEGVKKFKTEIVVQDMIMLEKRGDGTVSEGASFSANTTETSSFGDVDIEGSPLDQTPGSETTTPETPTLAATPAEGTPLEVSVEEDLKI